jgi:hypothetical protein
MKNKQNKKKEIRHVLTMPMSHNPDPAIEQQGHFPEWVLMNYAKNNTWGTVEEMKVRIDKAKKGNGFVGVLWGLKMFLNEEGAGFIYVKKS